ncbi:hypothetical protein [Halosimplex marinum]|uniref:hypothetical protein n=1 Tax=Halosimplex marinum TaxID=3396620 RepID=UPI003F576A2D
MDERSRRQILRLLGAGTTGLITGCSALNSGEENTSTESDTDRSTSTRTATSADTPGATATSTQSSSPTPTSTPTQTSTPSPTPTATAVPTRGLEYLRIEDEEDLLQKYGEEELTVESLEPRETAHTIQMTGDEREELYREDLHQFMYEEEYENAKEQMKDLNPEKFEHYITLSVASVSGSGFDDSTLSHTERGQFYSLFLRNITNDLHDEEIDDMRVGLIPFVKRTSEETNRVGAEVIDRDNDRHKTFFLENNSYQFKNPGSIGIVDGQADMYFGASEFEVMRHEINLPWNKALDSISPDKLQGMFRDQMVGFTNWNSVHEELEFEGREEAEEITSRPTPTSTPAEETSTPAPGETPLQIAAHEPFAEDYRQSIVDGNDDDKKYRMDLSDTLTDYVLNGDHGDTYGILVGGELEDPTLIEVDHEAAEFFDAVHDLEADRNTDLRELAETYQKTGVVPRNEEEAGTDTSGYTGLASTALAGAGIGAILRERYGEEGFTDGVMDAETGIAGTVREKLN